MTFFDAADVADFQDLVEEASPDTAIVRRATLVDDGHGGQTVTWNDIATVDGKVSMLGPTPIEQAIASQNPGRVLMLITLPAATDITHNDTVQVVKPGTDDVYEVVGVIPYRSFDVRRRVVAALVT